MSHHPCGICGERHYGGGCRGSKALVVGDRVIVAIPDDKRHEWATRSVDTLNGTIGVIEEINEKYDGCKLKLLVRFDEPVVSWHANSLPHTAFWFDPNELMVSGGK